MLELYKKTVRPMPTKIIPDGPFLTVEGDCPVCDWSHPHSHIKTYFQQLVQEKTKMRGKVHPIGGTTIADKPATPLPAKTPTVTNPIKSTTVQKPAETLNVYRVRTIGYGLKLDRTVMGTGKKAAIATACADHGMMVQVNKPNISLSFCRYIGKYKVPTYSARTYPVDYGQYWDM